MNLIDLLLLAVALGVDCFVVSFSNGLVFEYNRIKSSLYLALVMGICQGLMPVIGFVGTDYLRAVVMPFSKYIVFTIFLTLGLKFIFESFKDNDGKLKCLSFKCILSSGIATSIDALVAGATINLTSAPLIFSALLIGFASFLMSLSGFWLGNSVKILPKKYLEILGGLILIFLAIKNFV